MLNGFSLQNYRAFADKTEIELRPLTLLFGYNNSGKSALIRALSLLADSARASRGVLDLSSEAARGCSFEDLRSRFGGSEAIVLGLSFDENARVEATIIDDFRNQRLVVSELKVALRMGAEGVIQNVQARWLGRTLFGSEPDYEISVDNVKVATFKLKFSGLSPDMQRNGSSPDKIAERAFSKVAALSSFLGHHFQWLGSLRRHPPRYGRYQGEAPERMEPDGLGAAEILAYDKLGDGELLREVSRWYETNLQRRIEIVQSSDKRFSVVLEPTDAEAKRQVNLADTGEGMAQVLPVLVAATRAHRGGDGAPKILAIEQPELHLHPAVHAPLAEYLSAIAGAPDPPRMLIETHSENFLLGVQLEIVRRRLPAENALIYWVRQLDQGRSTVTRITFDDEGRPHGGWPPGVFSEDNDLTRELIRLRRDRRAA